MESKNRSEDLNFLHLAKQALSFLLDREFRITEESPNSLRYESPSVFADIFRDYQDHFIGFQVGTLDNPEDRLNMAEVMTLAGVSPVTGLQPRTVQQMEIDLAELARRLDAFGRAALEGDPAIFEAAKPLRRAYTEKYMRHPDEN